MDNAVLSGVLAALGVALLLQGLLPLRRSRFHFGLAICAGAGFLCLLFARWGNDLLAFLPAWVVGSAATLGAIAFVVFFTVSLFLRLHCDKNAVLFHEAALIVLGASVRDGRVGPTLRSRLDGALAYAAKNPKALIVVSGGRIGRQTVSEAEAMRRYLLLRGLAPGRVLAEDRSTNTRENFLFSAVLLREKGVDLRHIAFVTSRFHVYRAAKKARLAGLSPRAIGTSVPPFSMLPNYLRESLAVLRLWLLGY